MKKSIKILLRGLLRRTKMGRTFLYRRNKAARRYIAPTLGVEGFFDELNQTEVNYSVLRWFDELPYLAPGEDIDILVADEDLELIDRQLTGTPDDGIPCDIYSASGLPGTSWNDIPYYPPRLAEQILENSSIKGNQVRSPDEVTHFFSLAYHALFHKGYRSGIGQSDKNQPKPPEHDYQSVLLELAEKVGLPPYQSTMDGLYEFLADQGWTPPYDTQEKLAAINPWLAQRLDARVRDHAHYRGLSVFIIRRRGLEYQDIILEQINYFGFDLLREVDITNNPLAHTEIRGGVWGRGPWPASGGGPAKALICRDHAPQAPDALLKDEHPRLTNRNIYLLKTEVREQVNARISLRSRHCNVIHSADNPYQALEYIRIAHQHDELDLNNILIREVLKDFLPS